MGRNYLGFFWALCLVLSPAWAAEVLVGDLSLRYAPPWERGPAAEESADNSVILHWRGEGAALTAFLPHHQVELKVEAARFYRQLEQKWRALYGADARIYPLEVAGTQWRVCRRPSLEGDATVFQLVTVHAGRAHHLVLIAPGRLETLPDAAQHLVAGAAWDSGRSVVLTEAGREAAVFQQPLPGLAPQASSPEPPVPVSPPPTSLAPVPPVAAAPSPSEPAAAAAPPSPAVAAIAVEVPASVETRPAPQAPVASEAPSAAESALPAGETARAPAGPVPAKPEAAPAWRLARVVHALPRGARLAALAEAEAPRLGGEGMLTGYALSPDGQGIKGFLEGYVWEEQDGKRLKRRPLARHWQLGLKAPAELRPGEQDWRASLVDDPLPAADPAAGSESAPPGLRLELMALCGPRSEVIAGLDAVEKGRPGGAERLATLARACPAAASGAPSTTLPLASRQGVEQSVPLALPADWAVPFPVPGSTVKRLAVAARLLPAGTGLGDSLLAETVVYYIYVPREGQE